jgi:hypothetical protein
MGKKWFLAKNYFSSKKCATTAWEWSEWGWEKGTRAVIGREVWNYFCYWSINQLTTW